MQRVSTVLILLAAVINLVPVSGAFSVARLEALYGLVLEEANLRILMHHRALLFALVGGLLAASAFRPTLRPLAFGFGLASMLSFVLVAWLVGDMNDQLRRVALVDGAGTIALLAALAIDQSGVGTRPDR